jgi:hypothetical protein
MAVGSSIVDCADANAVCGIGAADIFEPQGEIVVVPISFTPQPPGPDPFRIVGTVAGPDGQPLSGVDVWAYLPQDSWVGSQTAVTAADGSFTLEDVTPNASYRVRFGAPAGSGLVSEWYSTSLPDGSPYRNPSSEVVASGAMPAPVLAAQLALGGTIEGQVTDELGTPVEGVSVWGVLPLNRLVGTYLAVTSADGSYRIEGVWPGIGARLRFSPGSTHGLVPEWFDDIARRADADVVAIDAGSIFEADAALSAT